MIKRYFNVAEIRKFEKFKKRIFYLFKLSMIISLHIYISY